MEDSRHLVADASRGDPTAIEALIERHLPGLLRYVGRRAGRTVLDKESAADVVQSVCREVFESLRVERFEYRGEREFKQWLYGAALYKIQDRRRYWHAGKRDLQRAPGSHPSHEPVASETPSVQAMRREESERLRKALSRLPPSYRRVIELAHDEGLSHRQIAERLSISETNSRVLLSRALAHLATLGERLGS